MDIKISEDKHSRRLDLDEIESKTIYKDEESDKDEENKTLSEVKQVKNISKNLQSFLEIRPM